MGDTDPPKPPVLKKSDPPIIQIYNKIDALFGNKVRLCSQPDAWVLINQGYMANTDRTALHDGIPWSNLGYGNIRLRRFRRHRRSGEETSGGRRGRVQVERRLIHSGYCIYLVHLPPALSDFRQLWRAISLQVRSRVDQMAPRCDFDTDDLTTSEDLNVRLFLPRTAIIHLSDHFGEFHPCIG